MAALDDALNESVVVFGPHRVTSQWREVVAGEAALNPGDSLVDLSSQLDGSITVTHSHDDALPDSVTMTGGGNACGSMAAGLVGREALTLATYGMRTWDNTQGTGNWNSGAATTSIVIPIAGAVYGDFLIAAVAINDSTATLVQVTPDPKDQWTFAGTIADSPIATYVYYKRRWSSNPALTLMSDKSVNFTGISACLWARNPFGSIMDYDVTDGGFLAEASSGTTHTVSSTIKNPGFRIGFWGSASSVGVSTVPGLTLIGNPALNGVQMVGAMTALIDSGYGSVSMVTTNATAVVAMAAMSVEPYARPRMDARQFWSPFNTKSPVYGFARDVADVTSSIRTLTATGSVDTQIFSGQMLDIPLSGQDVTLQAASKTRIGMNRSIALPVVNGLREGLSIDWMATYLMARGGSFVGAAPNKYTRSWIPMYGSLHGHWGGPNDYSAAYYWEAASPLLLFGQHPPDQVPGKYISGMYGQQTATKTIEVFLNTRDTEKYSTTEFPHLTGANAPQMNDIMSLSNSKGRVSFWVRGDAAVSAPSYLPGGSDFLVFFQAFAQSSTGSRTGDVRFYVHSDDRQPWVSMGNDVVGLGLITPGLSYALPTDGAWHFYAFWWDFAAGQYTLQVDNLFFGGPSTYFGTNGFNDTTGLPNTDAQNRAGGGLSEINTQSHLPISDLMVDTGNSYSGTIFTDLYPTPAAPGGNATMRATMIPMKGLAESTPVNAWDTFAELARCALASYRANETDALEFLPLSYFGETAQTTIAAVQDTKTNIGDLDGVVDSSKVRNVVTLKFQDSRVDFNPQSVLEYQTVVPIPPGTSIITFPLDVPTVEIDGAADPKSTTYRIVNLTSTQISTPTLPASHWITANTAQDGSGTVLDNTKVFASFVSVDAQSINIQFVNRQGSTVYLANNGNEVSFLRIRGYGFRQSDGYVTARDSSSVLIRGERGLDADMNWIHDRVSAGDVAGQLATMLARPRPQLALRVFGDPRRKPGQLVTILDAEGIKVSGSWRILSVSHNANGPAYTQDLTVVQVLPAALWDTQGAWDTAVWS